MANLINQIMSWESGEMNETDEDTFFQDLVNSGLVWQLQGAYGRNAVALASAGRITLP
jgi:hypothetical protein